MVHDHNESAETSSSWPDDPERQPDDAAGPVERPADDVLLGAQRIAEHLTELLGVPVNAADVYYAHRAKKLPIGKYGALLIASKKRLGRHTNKLTRGQPRAEQPEFNVEE
jgi:hypothetical protein